MSAAKKAERRESAGMPLTGVLSILVLTRNEQLHIERCLRSALRLTRDIVVLDSHSSDATEAIARKLGASVVSTSVEGFAAKLNWGLEKVEFRTPWVMRLDADEVLSDDLVERLPEVLAGVGSDVSGIYLRRQLWFMGRWMRHGGMYPTYSMRLWRRGAALCEARELDEHMVLRHGVAATRNLDIIDNPLTGLDRWIQKHNEYSTREAAAAVSGEGEGAHLEARLLGTSPQRRRWWKTKVFYRVPPLVRPSLYFLFRYLVQRGFMDGAVGFVFHFMHGYWYRCLVDAKLMEKGLRREGTRGEGGVAGARGKGRRRRVVKGK